MREIKSGMAEDIKDFRETYGIDCSPVLGAVLAAHLNLPLVCGDYLEDVREHLIMVQDEMLEGVEELLAEGLDNIILFDETGTCVRRILKIYEGIKGDEDREEAFKELRGYAFELMTSYKVE